MTSTLASDSTATRRRFWRSSTKGLVISVLTGTMLAVLARPVFWQEGLYLEDLDSTEARDRQRDLPLPRISSGQDRQGRQRGQAQQPIRVGRLPSANRDRPPADAAAEGFTTPEPASADIEPSPTLQISRGFYQERRPAAADALQQVDTPQPTDTPEADTSQPLQQSITQSLTALLLPPTDLSSVLSSSAPLTAPIPELAEAAPLPFPSSPSTTPSPEDPAVATAPPERPLSSDAAPAGVTEPAPLEMPEEPSLSDNVPPQTAALPDQIQVNQFVVTGSTVFDPEDLAAIALSAVLEPAGLETAEDLCEVREPASLSAPLSLTPSQLVRASDAIEQCYIQENYINSGAFIAETELTEADDGVVEISVVEGQLEAINIEMIRSGLFGLNSSYVGSRLEAAIGDPFNLDDLIEAVQLLELDPLITQISTEIVPGTQTGTSVLNARVVQDDGFDMTLFLDNDRSPSVGSLRRGIALSQANLLGIGDRLNLGYNFTEGSNELSLGYAVPINARNGTVGVNFTTTNSDVIEDPFTVLDIESESRNYEIFYRQPLILTPTEEFALSLRATRRTSQAQFLETLAGEPIPFPGIGADAEGRTRITALRFGQEWITRNSQEVIALFSEFSFGLDALGATIQPIPPDGRFLLWRGQGQWVRRLGPDSLFLLRGNIQLADRPLVPNEQFSFGGQRAGRGYRLNTLLRDNGWFLSGEFRLPLFRVPEDDILMQVSPFFDVGGGWNDGDVPDTTFLTSTGLGLILDVNDTISARLDWGIPLSDFDSTGTDLQDSGIYFSIQVTP
ncbi:MAG: BamA/TamA family outer membrane protein [Leptolyngbya sp. SIO1D8]|nr:BamA/TamA family outer membrane protein [Leptolyngbya sp. SIO1D8]